MTKLIHFLSMFFLVLSGLNWGMITLFQINVIEYLFDHSVLENITYILMCLSGIWAAVNWKHLITTKRMLKP